MKTETNNKDSKVVKLSPKQKEVIRLMREGKFIYAINKIYDPKAWVRNTIEYDSWLYSISLPYRTFEILYNNGFLITVRESTSAAFYSLSELGQTIDIN